MRGRGSKVGAMASLTWLVPHSPSGRRGRCASHTRDAATSPGSTQRAAHPARCAAHCTHPLARGCPSMPPTHPPGTLWRRTLAGGRKRGEV